MVSPDSGAVVTNDEVKAAVLDYLYEHLATGAYTVNLHDATELPVNWCGRTRLFAVLDELRAEGKIDSWMNAWFRLTPAAWLFVTASRQQCSNTSTCSQALAPVGK